MSSGFFPINNQTSSSAISTSSSTGQSAGNVDGRRWTVINCARQLASLTVNFLLFVPIINFIFARMLKALQSYLNGSDSSSSTTSNAPQPTNNDGGGHNPSFKINTAPTPQPLLSTAATASSFPASLTLPYIQSLGDEEPITPIRAEPRFPTVYTPYSDQQRLSVVGPDSPNSTLGGRSTKDSNQI